MPDIMSTKKCKTKQLKAQLAKEFDFLKNVFSVLNLPNQKAESEENADYEIIVSQKKEETEMPKRARSIAELEEKLQKIKSQKIFNLKNKLAKKSLSSKLNKKNKKKERKELNKNRIKTNKKGQQHQNQPLENDTVQTEVEEKPNNKPVFNSDAKLVFSKFDFSNMGGGGKPHKNIKKEPKKLLENLREQELKLEQLEKSEHSDKAKEIKEKIAWKNLLQKAEGEKVKDDPILLKKSIKKMEQKKKHSKKQWEGRIKGVEQKKEERQKKRKENISKKKKEKKAKVVKAAVKRGRVVI